MAKTVKKNTIVKKATPAAHNCPYCNAEMKALNYRCARHAMQ